MISYDAQIHTYREDEKMREASQRPHFQIIIVEANMEEVTESYVPLSSPTYPQGGFNCQSSPSFLSSSGWLWEQALSLALRHWDDMSSTKKKCQNISLKAFVIFPAWTQTWQDWTGEIGCRFCLRGANATEIHPMLSDYHARSELSTARECDRP